MEKSFDRGNSSRGKSRYSQKRNANKRNSPVAAKSVPVKEYISACCSVPARKPALVKQSTDKKSKEIPKGLGKWRCGACGKRCSVTPRKPEPKTETVPVYVPVPIVYVGVLSGS